MRKTKNVYYFILCLFAFFIWAGNHISIAAEEKHATTTDGKEVILHPDGTWQYAPTDSTNAETTIPRDCSTWITTTEDKVTGTKRTSVKRTLIVSKDEKNGFGINMMNSKDTLIVSITAVGASSCIEESSKVNLLFSDDNRMELASDGKFNCDGNVPLYFGGLFGKKKQLDTLLEKKIQTLRVWTSKGYVEEDFTKDQALEFQGSMQCLAKVLKQKE